MTYPDTLPDEREIERQFRAAQRLLPALVEEEPPVTQTPQRKGYSTEVEE